MFTSLRTTTFSSRTLRTAVATGAVCLTALAACSSDPQAPSTAGNGSTSEAPSASSMAPAPNENESSAPSAAPDGSIGAASLTQPLRDATPPTIAAKLASCAESDTAMPVMFGSEQMHGFTCLLPLESGAVVMMTTAEDPALVNRIAAEAEGVRDYAPLDIPGMSAFQGVSKGTSFVMTYSPNQGIYQEFACGGVPNEQAGACVDEIVAGLKS